MKKFITTYLLLAFICSISLISLNNKSSDNFGARTSNFFKTIGTLITPILTSYNFAVGGTTDSTATLYVNSNSDVVNINDDLIINGTATANTFCLSGDSCISSWVAGSMTALPQGNIYVGNGSNEAEATSSMFMDSKGNVGFKDTTPTDGRLDINVLAGDNIRAIQIDQNDTTNNPEGVRITSTAAENALVIDMNGDAGNSTSVGGALNLDCTGNPGACAIIYSNEDNDADGRLLNIRADNALFDQPALHVDYDGTANAVEIVGNGVTNDAVALSINHTNWSATALGISGDVENHGMIKLRHFYPSGGDGATLDDSSASILSMDFQNSSSTIDTHVQGIFSTATVGNGTRGKLINLRNITEESGIATELFTVTYDGMLGLLDPSPDARFEITGTTSDPYLYVTGFGEADGNIFSIDSAGQVGIGTSDATYSLDVAGNAGFDEFLYHNGDADTFIKFVTNRIEFDSGGTRTMDLVNGKVGIATSSPSQTLDVNGTTRTTNLTVVTNSELGTITSGTWNGAAIGTAYGGTGTTTQPGAGQMLIGNADGSYSYIASSSLGGGSGTVNSSIKGQVAFYDANGNAVSGTSTITINSDETITVGNGDAVITTDENGNVGIGTTTPDYQLDVVGETFLDGNATTSGIMVITNGTNGVRIIPGATTTFEFF